MSEKFVGWHSVRSDLKLGYGDDRVITIGGTLSIPDDKKPKIGVFGLHATPTVYAARSYGDGRYLTKVEVWGDLDKCEDRVAGRHRKVLGIINYLTLTEEYHRKVILDNLPLRLQKMDGVTECLTAKKKMPDHTIRALKREIADLEMVSWLRQILSDDDERGKGVWGWAWYGFCPRFPKVSSGLRDRLLKALSGYMDDSNAMLLVYPDHWDSRLVASALGIERDTLYKMQDMLYEVAVNKSMATGTIIEHLTQL